MDSSTNQSSVDEKAPSNITSKVIGDSLQEYETQYFGFTPKSFVDGVFNALADYLYDSVDAADKYIASEVQKGRQPVCAEAVRESSDRLLAHLQLAFEKAFDRLETYLMKNIFPISSHVTLPEDKVHCEVIFKDSDEMKLDEELEELRNKIKNAEYVNSRLEQWSNDAKLVQKRLEDLHHRLEEHQKVCIQANVSDLKESITFMTSHADKLLDLSRTLLHGSKRKPASQDDDNIPVKKSLRSGST